MKKIIIALLAGLLCATPASMMARDYKGSDNPPIPTFPRMPVANIISVTVDEATGEVTMYFSEAIDDLTISLKQNGVTLDSIETSVALGETVLYELEDYDEGEYTLVFETPEGTIKTYYITIED
jgi:Protein of unknown function (DUF3244).